MSKLLHRLANFFCVNPAIELPYYWYGTLSGFKCKVFGKID